MESLNAFISTYVSHYSMSWGSHNRMALESSTVPPTGFAQAVVLFVIVLMKALVRNPWNRVVVAHPAGMAAIGIGFVMSLE